MPDVAFVIRHMFSATKQTPSSTMMPPRQHPSCCIQKQSPRPTRIPNPCYHHHMHQLFIGGVRQDWDDAHDGSTQSANSTDTDSPDYTRSIPALRSLREREFDNPLTFFNGENGTGKSTLLEALAPAYGFNAEDGERNYRFSTYDDTFDLSPRTTLIRQRGYGRSGYFFLDGELLQPRHQSPGLRSFRSIGRTARTIPR